MSAISLKCPNCDGELVFDPRKQNYKCEYCLSVFSEEELNKIIKEEETRADTQADAKEAQKQTQTKDYEDEPQGKIYECPSCGAQILTEETTAATFCYYCHNPVIFKGQLEGDFLPDRMIPFQIDKKEATEKFVENLSKKRFVPNAFFNKNQIEKITGVYFPYWVYRAKMSGSLEAKGIKIRTWIAGSEEYTEKQFFHVLRSGEIEIEHLTKDALQKANRKLVEGVLPFDVAQASKFQMAKLSGFMAEKRDIESDIVRPQMVQEAQSYANHRLRDEVESYQSLLDVTDSYAIQKDEMEYMLFPVWSFTYKGKNDKIFYYSMNAQTGKISGELPINYKKLCFYSALIFLVVLGLGLLGGYLLW